MIASTGFMASGEWDKTDTLITIWVLGSAAILYGTGRVILWAIGFYLDVVQEDEDNGRENVSTDRRVSEADDYDRGYRYH